MVFWILVVLIVAIIVATFLYHLLDGDGFLLSLMFALICGIIDFILSVIIMIAAMSIPGSWSLVSSTQYHLAALHTSESIEGRSYFLGAGYVEGKRVLHYITVDDGAYRVESADASRSVIYQDSETPSLTVERWEEGNPWVAPFPTGSYEAYEFHIPEGSIIEQYEVR